MTVETAANLAHVMVTCLVGYYVFIGIGKVEWILKCNKDFLKDNQLLLSDKYYDIRRLLDRIQDYAETLPQTIRILTAVLGVDLALIFANIVGDPGDGIKAAVFGANICGLLIITQLQFVCLSIVNTVDNYAQLIRQQEKQDKEDEETTKGKEQ